MKSEIEIKYTGKNVLVLHKEIGRGRLPDERECQLIQTNAGIHMQVNNKDGKGCKMFSVSYMALSKAFCDIIPELEKEE